MKKMIALCAPAVVAIICMALTYPGNAQEQEWDISMREVIESETPAVVDYELPKAGVAELSFQEQEPTELISQESVISHNLNLDDGEINELIQIAAAEANTEDVTGQALVMCVVLNRLKDEEFPDSIYEVLRQKVNGRYQFSPIKNGTFWSVEVNVKTYKALELVLSGWDESRGATYFCSPDAAKKWHEENLEFVFQYGCHRFYVE